MATSCIALSPSRLHVALHRRRPQPPRAPALRQSPAREAQKAKRPGLPVPLFPVRRPPAEMANVARSPGQLQHEASASSLPRMQKGRAASRACSLEKGAPLHACALSASRTNRATTSCPSARRRYGNVSSISHSLSRHRTARRNRRRSTSLVVAIPGSPSSSSPRPEISPRRRSPPQCPR